MFKQLLQNDSFFEGAEYYKNHEYRYRYIFSLYSKLRKGPSDVLDIGGGQYALLAHKIYGDNATAADIGKPNEYLQANGVETIECDMCRMQTFDKKYDVIFFSEVLEHLPMPAYFAFETLKEALKPDGVIICNVPNLTSLENIYCFITNKKVFENFQEPNGTDLGHVILYTKEHLDWQIRKAGLTPQTWYSVSLKYHRNILRNILFALGFPLFIFPHLRTEIMSIIRKEQA